MCAALLLAGCSAKLDKGYAVAVTIDRDRLAQSDIDSITRLLIHVSNAETWDNGTDGYAVGNQFKAGQAQWLYRPAATTTGTLDFAVSVQTDARVEVANGKASRVLDPGKTVEVTIVLARPATDDMGPPDMAGAVKQVGEPCVAGVDRCSTGKCVDKFCCDSDCTGNCQTCALPGSEGMCSSVPAGQVPTHGTCPIKSANDPVNPCQTDGKCDGAGGCELWPAGTPASPRTCVGNTETPPDVCDGLGGKVSPPGIACAPFICNSNKACFGPPCGDSTVCSVGNTCNLTTGSCGTLADGRVCTTDTQCTHGHCVDGVCCESTCTGQCQACDNPLTLGKCAPVTGAPHAPAKRGVCTGNNVNSCGGKCDGVNTAACTYPPSSKACVSPSCSNNMGAAGANCDGAGSCNIPAAVACPSANNATGVCVGTKCGLACQMSNFANCSGNVATGCETNLLTDNRNCGSCGNDCTAIGQTCASGACTCGSGFKPCANTCIPQAACCKPADCSCTPTTAGTDSDCVARMRGRDYGFSCGGNVCSPTVTFNDPKYATCEAVCGINKMCCPSK